MTRARELARLGNSNIISADSSFNVGIGSTTPDAKLDVVGVVSATEYYGDGSNLTGVSAGLWEKTDVGINTVSNVGIGTTNPGYTLEVYQTNIPGIRLNDGGEYKALFELRGNDLEIRGSNGQMEFYTGHPDGSSSTERMRITPTGNVGLNVDPGNFGNDAYRGIQVHSGSNAYLTLTNSDTGNLSSTDGFSLALSEDDINLIQRENADMIFHTNNAERLRIIGNGNVGIGSTIPQVNLDVKGSSATKAYFAHNSSNQTSLYLESDDDSARVGSTYHGGGSFKPLELLTSGVKRVHISAGGDVGIGTTNPSVAADTNNTTILNAGIVTANTFYGDGSQLTGISAGIGTAATSPPSNTIVFLNLATTQHHELTLNAGITTITTTGGSFGDSHSLVLIQPSSGIATVGFSTYFLWPSGSSPVLSQGSSKVDLISFVVKNNNASAGITTQLLASAGINYQ